jgi:hypothetical protein
MVLVEDTQAVRQEMPRWRRCHLRQALPAVKPYLLVRACRPVLGGLGVGEFSRKEGLDQAIGK